MNTSIRASLLLLPLVVTTGAAQTVPMRPIEVFHVLGGDGSIGRVRSALVTDDRFVYVLDDADFNIKVYDSSGSLIRTMGRKGRGPGEFSYPVTLRFVDGTLVVTDGHNGVVRYSISGQHLSTSRTDVQRNASPMRFGAQLNTVRGIPSVTSAGQLVDTTIVVEIVSRSGKRDTIARVNVDWSRWQTPSGRPAVRITGFGYDKAWATMGDSMVAVADGYTGDVTWYDITPQGVQAARKSSLQLTAREITRAEIERQEQFQSGSSVSISYSTSGQPLAPRRMAPSGKFLDVPKRWSVASLSAVSPDGTVWFGAPLRVRRSNNGLESITDTEIQNNVWTAFTAMGAPFRISLPPNVRMIAIKGNRVYCVPLDDNDRVVIYTFR